jgi:uncharacterized SAM-dependent methyltransferase
MAESKKPEINDLIFKELIKRGYALDGNTRIWNIADSKLWYLKPDQAQAYLDLLDTEDYNKNFGPKEKTLIKTHIDEILEKIEAEHINLIDLGCGDGRKAIIFVEKLKNKKKVRYCPIDISDYMVNKALKNIRKTDVEEVVKFQWNISDFENIENVSNLLRFGDFKKNFFLLLGNTLSNFEINELLYEVRSGMKGGDYLLIGNGIDNNNVEKDVIEFCKKNKKNNEFLIKIPLQLGLTRDELKLGSRFKNSRIEFYYTILKDKTITFQNKEVNFQKNDQIIVATSYYYTKNDFMSFLKLYFNEVSLNVSDDKSYCLAFCKK